MIPATEQCLQLLKKYELPDNVIAHSKKVRDVAIRSEELKKRGEQINIPLLNAAALLHDLDKIKTLGENFKKHGYVTKEILLKEGFSEDFAQLVLLHKAEHLLDFEYNNWEEKLLVYADSRTLDDKTVSFEQRFQYAINKYPHLRQPKFQEVKQKVLKLEEFIFSKLDINPDDLNDQRRKII